MIFCAWLMLTAAGTVTAETRTWNLKSGATVEAEIVGFPNAQSVTVKRTDGKVYTLQDAYLADEDREFVQAERAKLWKEVSIDKVLGPVSGSRYRKCVVSGKDVSGQILVTMLPATVEPVLNKRQEQEAQIAALNTRIQTDEKAAHSKAKTNNRYGSKTNARAAAQDETSAKGDLARARADHEDYLKKTKASTTLLMKNTGLTYEGYPVWECQAPQK